MSSIPENEFDLEKLFLPAWAQEPASTKQYAKFAGEDAGRADDRHERRGRGPRRDFGPPGRDQRPRNREGGPRPPHRDGGRRPPSFLSDPTARPERPPPPAPVPESS